MNNQEINISELINAFFVNTYKFIAKWYKFLVLSFILGVVVAILFLFLKGNTYTSTMMIKPNAVNHITLQEIMSTLEPLAGKSALSETLGISLKDAKNIKKISSDTTETTQFIEIKVVYKDTVDLNKVEKGIVNFVNNNNYISEIIELSKEANTKIKEELITTMKGLDSLQELTLLKYKKEAATNYKQQLVINAEKINFYHNDIENRAKEIIAIERSLKRIKGFDILRPFNTIKLKHYSLIKVLFISIFIFVFLGFILIIILDIKQQVQNETT